MAQAEAEEKMTAFELNVTDMPRASVAEDGSIVQLTFCGENGEAVLTFSAERFEEFSQRSIQLFTHARNQRLAIGDHFGIRPVEAVVAVASAPVGGGKVIVGFRGSNDVEYHFAIVPDEARILRTQ